MDLKLRPISTSAEEIPPGVHRFRVVRYTNTNCCRVFFVVPFPRDLSVRQDVLTNLPTRPFDCGWYEGLDSMLHTVLLTVQG